SNLDLMKTNALVGEAASFCFVASVFNYFKMSLLQQNKRYSATHDLKGNAQKRKLRIFGL
ncbi:MAG: hypothetical protein V4666_12125, partial [Bacteroidota bacterium]